jgi:hypothetical protein
LGRGYTAAPALRQGFPLNPLLRGSNSTTLG